MEELKPCPFCGGEPRMHDGRYSDDGRADRAWMVCCRECGALVSKMPEYGEGNYWWLHTTEGEKHMREAIAKKWNARHKLTCHPVEKYNNDSPWPVMVCSECGRPIRYDEKDDDYQYAPYCCCGAKVVDGD